ncbi:MULTISPECIES: hypothetical protein [Flavobacterium]|uniref:(P)ppGpp synthase/HD superfamily hydrolase n=3 Tax=Flavobacterium TaxID=237 RepID=A0A7W7J1H1_9FLAO|nr:MULTISPECIES: hypothetical protein [Flavobacterium]MBB4803760.1 (p)ppGpp synthase/HD superfamily hydrolase [Flavobacterium nitrogenifigens]MBB6388435.1 (p)ppGpp synthase/HD superfamily hydrolase [Flavobacterium notoginsengisoli]WPO79603.1 hypothetical protein SCB73_04290 [Flavobacterium sp. KACC 22761]
MNIQTSKIELAKIVLDIENPDLIQEIVEFIQSKESLSEEQKSKINEAIYSLDNNEGISHDVVMEETKNRYSKYFK